MILQCCDRPRFFSVSVHHLFRSKEKPDPPIVSRTKKPQALLKQGLRLMQFLFAYSHSMVDGGLLVIS